MQYFNTLVHPHVQEKEQFHTCVCIHVYSSVKQVYLQIGFEESDRQNGNFDHFITTLNIMEKANTWIQYKYDVLI